MWLAACVAALSGSCGPSDTSVVSPAASPPPKVSTPIDRDALRVAAAHYAAAFQASAEQAPFRMARADFDGDGRTDVLAYFADPHWCDERGCRAAIFQSTPEGMRLISDFPSLRPPFFLSWRMNSLWRDLYAWDGGEADEEPPLARARVLRFAGRGYWRHPRLRERDDPPPERARGEWLRFETEPFTPMERLVGQLRVGRKFQGFRVCGEDWSWAHDATVYGFEDAFAAHELPMHRAALVEVDATRHPHPPRCEVCQRFSVSVTVFRVRGVAGDDTACPGPPTS